MFSKTFSYSPSSLPSLYSVRPQYLIVFLGTRYYDDHWQWHSFEKHVSFNVMLKYHIIILLQQFTKTFKQFFKLLSNLSRAKWAIEWIKGVVRYTFKYCLNKWKLYPKKKKYIYIYSVQVENYSTWANHFFWLSLSMQ